MSFWHYKHGYAHAASNSIGTSVLNLGVLLLHVDVPAAAADACMSPTAAGASLAMHSYFAQHASQYCGAGHWKLSKSFSWQYMLLLHSG